MFRHAMTILIPVLITVLVMHQLPTSAGTGGNSVFTGGLGEGEIPVSWTHSTVVTSDDIQFTVSPGIPSSPGSLTNYPRFTQVVQAPATHGILFREISPNMSAWRRNHTRYLELFLDGKLIHESQWAPSESVQQEWRWKSPILVRPGESLEIRVTFDTSFNTNGPPASTPIYQTSVAFIPASFLPQIPPM